MGMWGSLATLLLPWGAGGGENYVINVAQPARPQTLPLRFQEEGEKKQGLWSLPSPAAGVGSPWWTAGGSLVPWSQLCRDLGPRPVSHGFVVYRECDRGVQARL